MAEIQIQDLPTALTPLGASDVLPVVQSGITRSVSISSGAFALTDKPNVFTSANTFSATSSSYRLRITSGAGNGKYVVYQTTGLTRWEIGSNSASETGSNNGSDLVINRYDDAGNYLASPLTIERDNGLTTLENLTVPTINMGNTDTTITRSAAGVIAVEGGVVPKENRANTFTATQSINDASLILNSNNDYTPQVSLTHAGATAGSASYSILSRARGTYNSATIVASGDQLGNLLFQGFDGTAMRSAASIEAQVDGTPGANDMPGRLTFKTTPDGGTAATERMRIDSAGNVGIGGTPGYKLDVVGPSGVSSFTGVNRLGVMVRGSSSGTDYSGIDFSGSANATTFARIGVLSTPSGSSIVLGTSNNYASGITNTALTIDPSGNVGIGTTVPTSKLLVSSSSGDAPNGLSGKCVARFQSTQTAAVGVGPSLLFEGQTGNSTANYSFAGIQGFKASATAGDYTGSLAFFTQNAGGGSALDEKMRIDGVSGNALIGYTTSNGAYKLQVNSQIFATNATVATSDGNYKEDITPLDGALDLVSALNPVQFSWKEHPVHNFDRAQPTVGFIAQEVQQALADTPYLNSIIKANTCTIEPEELDDEGNVTKPAVTEEFLGIAEGNMIALLTKAIQELKAEFDAYKASHP